MAFTKIASIEILDVKGSSNHREASLDKFADFNDFRTEDGYLYARIRAISSRVNKNHDGWPSVELAGGSEIFNKIAGRRTGHVVVAADKEAKFGYSTFVGKPIFVDHHNGDPKRARGVIVDSKLHIEDDTDPYYKTAADNHKPATWVELLLEIDAKSFPKLATAIIEGSENPQHGIDGFSMGCDVRYSKCSHCGNKASTPDQYCEHVKLKGAEFPFHNSKTGKTEYKKSYEDCYEIGFFEISAVFDPADETALLREIHAHTAAENTATWDEVENSREPYHAPIGFDSLDQRGDPLPGGEIACPTCQGRGCDQCYGTGVMNFQRAQPRGDGALSLEQLKPTDVNIEPVGQGQLGPRRQGSEHTAEAPPPQADELKMPEAVDTLREEQVCPVCGSDMDDETCATCGYTKPPDGFDNPDLSKANPELTQEQEPDGAIEPDIGASPDEASIGQPPDVPGAGTSNQGLTAHVTNDDLMSWTVSTNSRIAYTQPAKETPVIPNAPAATDEPKNATVKQDHTKPVTSNVKTAGDFLSAVDAQRRTMEHTAEAASGAPEVATPDKNIDVDGVGGIIEPSNEEASKADAQIDVVGVGTTGTADVAADKTESVDQGDEHSKNVEEIPTKTWGNGSGVEEQRDGVTPQVYPAEGGVTSSWQVQALDNDPYPHEDGGLAGGNANEGTQPADPVGTPDERVDVLDTVTSPENNSGETKTWSGTDGNGVTRQQDPVTNDVYRGDENINLSPSTSSAHIFAAMKLADEEVEMGLTDSSEKFERAAELEKLSPDELSAESRVVARVKTAGLSQQRQTMRMPAMGRKASVEKEASETGTSEFAHDSALFLS